LVLLSKLSRQVLASLDVLRTDEVYGDFDTISQIANLECVSEQTSICNNEGTHLVGTASGNKDSLARLLVDTVAFHTILCP
jgi:hypothetical protein